MPAVFVELTLVEEDQNVGFSDDRSARFCKTFNCNLKSNCRGG